MSVIVPVRNRREDLALCLGAICGNIPLPDEVIVVDDGSTDGSVEEAQRSDCIVIGTEYRGASFARNAGAKAAKNDVLAFVDSDVEIGTQHLGRIYRALINDSADGVFGIIDAEMKACNALSDFHNLTQHYVFANQAGDTKTCHTAFFAVRKGAFLEVGGFDEHWRKAVADDVILGWKLIAAGARLVCRDDMRFKHHKKLTLRGFIKSRFLYGYEWVRATLKYRHLVRNQNLRAQDKVVSMRTPVNVLLASLLAACPFCGRWSFAALVGLIVAVLLWNARFLGFLVRTRGAGFIVKGALSLLLEVICIAVGWWTAIITAPWASAKADAEPS